MEWIGIVVLQELSLRMLLIINAHNSMERKGHIEIKLLNQE